jgi:hypothetical protein
VIHSSDDLGSRQLSILENLQGDMRILMNEENTPKELKDNLGKLMIKNLEVYMNKDFIMFRVLTMM